MNKIMADQISLIDENDEYKAFVEKFKPKKTTDDCYTPDNIYEAVAGWVSERYDISREDMVRPFWPGEDFERYDYPDGCCVVDNPPFSLLAKIQTVYLMRGIRFFLFAPTLTLFSTCCHSVTYIPCGISITYDNGAKVNTSFVTNLDTCQVLSTPTLYRAIKRQNDANEKAATKQLPKYEYPDHILTASEAYQYSRCGIDFRLERDDCVFIRAMDSQRKVGKTIFGAGLLLSDKAAADKAAADGAVVKWELSEREGEIVHKMKKEAKQCTY